MEKTILKLRILSYAQSTLLQICMRRWVTMGILIALALSFLLITIAMINVAAFMWLQNTYSGTVSAVSVGAINLALAILFAYCGANRKPRADEKMVREIRDAALSELSDDVEDARLTFSKMKTDVGSLLQLVGSGKGLAGGMFDFGMASSLIGFFVKLLKRKSSG